MKGIVFTEFLEMVEDKFSPELADRIIEGAELPSGGIIYGCWNLSSPLRWSSLYVASAKKLALTPPNSCGRLAHTCLGAFTYYFQNILKASIPHSRFLNE